MWHYRNVVFLLYCCSNGNSARSASHTMPLKQPVVKFLIDVFAVMCCDIDISWAELTQRVNCLEKSICAVSFEWWQHLKRELPLGLRRVYDVCQCHVAISPFGIWLQNYEKKAILLSLLMVFSLL